MGRCVFHRPGHGVCDAPSVRQFGHPAGPAAVRCPLALRLPAAADGIGRGRGLLSGVGGARGLARGLGPDSADRGRPSRRIWFQEHQGPCSLAAASSGGDIKRNKCRLGCAHTLHGSHVHPTRAPWGTHSSAHNRGPLPRLLHVALAIRQWTDMTRYSMLPHLA